MPSSGSKVKTKCRKLDLADDSHARFSINWTEK